MTTLHLVFNDSLHTYLRPLKAFACRSATGALRQVLPGESRSRLYCPLCAYRKNEENCLFESPRSNTLSAFHEDYEADSDPDRKNDVGIHTSARTRRSKEHYAAKRAEYEKSRKHLCAADGCNMLVSRQATYCPHHAQQRARKIIRERKQNSGTSQV